MRLGLVGNCQVRGLALALSPIEDIEVEVLELWTKTEEELAQLDPARWDLIVAQPAYNPRYGQFHYDELLRLHRGKAVWIHSFHFQAAAPDCTYIGPLDNRLLGPMGHYHSSIVLNAYERGETLEDAVRRLEWGDESFDTGRLISDSVINLAEREKVIDVPYCGRLEELVANQRCFWTFNHPREFVLTEYASLVAQMVLGKTIPDAGPWPDLLEPIVGWPIYPWMRDALGLPYGGEITFRNQTLELSCREFTTLSYQAFDARAASAAGLN